MPSDDHTITPERTMLVAWMEEILPINPQPHPSKPGTSLRMFILGHDADDENNLIVCDETNGGGAWNFCQRHRFVYPNRGRCQPCQDAPQTVENGVPVAPRNGPA